MNNSFAKNLRLLNADDYSSVFNQAKYRISSRFLLMLAIPNTVGNSRVGIVVAKKNIPKAVQRNRIKRLIRESFRVNQVDFGTIDLVVLVKRGLDKLENQAITRQLEDMYNQLHKKTQLKRSADNQHG